MTRTASEHAAWDATRRELLDVLTAAQRERDQRREANDVGQPAWIAWEFGVMHDAVNRLRARLGKAPVTARAVEDKERLALGHVDYTRKWALHCADLVHDL